MDGFHASRELREGHILDNVRTQRRRKSRPPPTQPKIKVARPLVFGGGGGGTRPSRPAGGCAGLKLLAAACLRSGTKVAKSTAHRSR